MPSTADIYYHAYNEEEKSRVPVVLIHGAGGNHMSWPSEVRRLPGYRVYALDLPGHGKSSGCGQQSISAYVQAVLAWMEAMELGRAVYVGHSMGGAIVLSMALQAPEQALALGLAGSAARLHVAPSILECLASETTVQSGIETILSASFAPGAPEFLTSGVASRMAETRQTVLYGDFQACDGFDLTDRIPQIQQPALVICGEADQMTPVRHSQFLATALPNARLQTVPNAGHMVMLEQPQVVAAALADFLHTLPY